MEEQKTSGEIKYELIVAIVNQGHSDELIATAREAGAQGGTVINARGLTHRGPVKFFDIAMQAEKEIIIILTNKEQKLAIMQIVSRTYGISTRAEGMIFSLPVGGVAGLDLA